MVKEFSIFGSCASRTIFNSHFNNNYKKYFHINYSVESSSLISLMSKPVHFKESLIDADDKYVNRCVTDDITKNFKEFLKEDKLDYLILDTYFDVAYPVIQLNKNQFVTGTNSLTKTTFYKELADYPKIGILNNFDEFCHLYIKYCNNFFKFLEKNCKNLKVILNGARSVYRYCDNGQVIENSNFKKISYINYYRDYLEKYILENYDVEFLTFDNNTLYDPNWLFGVHHTHYEPKYFEEKTEQLKSIIRRNEIIPWEDKLNKSFRKNLRQNIILKWENIKLKNEISDIEFPKIFSKYITARIDIKNEGLSNNQVEIIENSDLESIVLYPDWFKDEYGVGTQIQSKKGCINLKIKCINEGMLKISLRGIDFKNENDKRIPIYINYTNFNVNEENVILRKVSACHDKPITHIKPVKDSEILDISVKWMSI